MCSAIELIVKVCYSEQQSFEFFVMFQDIDFFLVTTKVKAKIENVCDDLLHLCTSMSLSDSEEIIMLSLSGDHNIMQYH